MGSFLEEQASRVTMNSVGIEGCNGLFVIPIYVNDFYS